MNPDQDTYTVGIVVIVICLGAGVSWPSCTSSLATSNYWAGIKWLVIFAGTSSCSSTKASKRKLERCVAMSSLVKIFCCTRRYGGIRPPTSNSCRGLVAFGSSLASGAWEALRALLKVDGIILKESKKLFHCHHSHASVEEFSWLCTGNYKPINFCKRNKLIQST